MDMVDGYEVVGSFECGNRHMIVIKAAHGTHVVPDSEWELMKQLLTRDYSKSYSKRENSKVA